MVGREKAKQREGYDYSEYVLIDSSANPWGANNIGVYIVGTTMNASALAALMAATPVPTTGGPATAIGPQYPWPYHGSGPAPAAMPLNVAEVQRTGFSVITNDMNVWLLDERLARFLTAWLALNPNLALLGPTGGGWPLPSATLLEVRIGQYTFERKWIWLFYQRAAADADSDLHVYMEG